jgi:hypothetical protein
MKNNLADIGLFCFTLSFALVACSVAFLLFKIAWFA